MTRWITVPIIGRYAALLVVVLVAGCAGAAQPERDVGRQSAFRVDQSTYTYVLESSCGERALGGMFRIEVVDGAVVAVDGLDDAGRAFVDQYGRDEVPTIADLLDEVETAKRRGADVVDVDVTDDGRPTHITIDGETDAYDDEACYVISEVTDTR